MVRTKEQYIKDLGRMKPNLYYDGKEFDRLDALHNDCFNTIGTTFDCFDDHGISVDIGIAQHVELKPVKKLRWHATKTCLVSRARSK